MKSTVPCPDCGSNIELESIMLLAGVSFECSNNSCSASISLSAKDTSTVADTIDRFEELKRNCVTNSGI